MAYLKNSLTINVTSVYSSFVCIYTNKGQSLSTPFFVHTSYLLPSQITQAPTSNLPVKAPKSQCVFQFIYLFTSTKATSFTHTPTMKWNINGVISSQRCCTTTKNFIQKVTRLHKRETMISLLIYIQNIYLKDTAIKGQYM